MKTKLYYNTLYQCTTDGRKVWTNKDSSDGFIPKGRSQVYYKINGKIISRKQLLSKYLVRIKENPLPF